MSYELCCCCDQATGHAGKGEDSLYANNEYGPYCDDCWHDVPALLGDRVEEQAVTIAELRKECDRLRAELDDANGVIR
jgi:hypothetical protein